MEILLILTMVFFSVFFLVLGLTPSKKVDIKAIYGSGPDTEIRSGVVLLLTPLSKKMEKLNSALKHPSIQRYKKYLKERLMMSGNKFKLSPDEFMSFQEILFIVLMVFSLLFMFKMPEGSFFQKILFILIVIFAVFLISFMLPLMFLNDAIKERHKKISRELPHTLDLLTISVEAGLDFIMAIDRVIDKGAPGPLKQELMIMMKQMRLGKRRREALQEMADRNGHPDLKTIVAAMIQADQMGASLGPILRIQSDLLRQKRMLRAEKVAQEAPVKMLMPLIGCIFPAVFLVLLVPIILKLIYTF